MTYLSETLGSTPAKPVVKPTFRVEVGDRVKRASESGDKYRSYIVIRNANFNFFLLNEEGVFFPLGYFMGADPVHRQVQFSREQRWLEFDES